MNHTPSSPLSDPARAVAGGWRAWAVALGLVLFLAPQTRGADVAMAKEHQLKAAFIYNFTKFIEWPSKNFASADSPIVIGVVGQGPLHAEVARVVKDRKVNGRELVVRLIEDPDAIKTVHVLFFFASEDARLDEFMSATHGANILTVGESDLFAQQGGAINFLMEQDKIRFDIDMTAAERAGLKVSAQLQKLAKTVRTAK